MGAAFGVAFPGSVESLRLVLTISLRLISVTIIPLLFAVIVAGLGRRGLESRTEETSPANSSTSLDVPIALGLGLMLELAKLLTVSPASDWRWSSLPERLVPQSFVEAGTGNSVIQVTFFSVLFGLGLSRVRGRAREAMLRFSEGLAEAMFRFIAIILTLAPLAIGAAAAITVGRWRLGMSPDLKALVVAACWILLYSAHSYRSSVRLQVTSSTASSSTKSD